MIFVRLKDRSVNTGFVAGIAGMLLPLARSVAYASADERRVIKVGPVAEWSQMKWKPVAENEYPDAGVTINWM